MKQPAFETWKLQNGFRDGIEPRYRIRLIAPREYAAIECFLRALLSRWEAGGWEYVFYLADRSPSEAARDSVFNAFASTGRHWSPGESIACTLSDLDVENLVALSSLATCYLWKSWVYVPEAQTEFESWEGEFLTLWTNSEIVCADVRQEAKAFGLEERDFEN